MSRRYSLAFNVDSVTTAKQLAIITAPAAAPIKLKYIAVTARGVLTAEQLSVAVDRVASLGTPTVTLDNLLAGNNNLTLGQLDTEDAAAQAIVRGNVTASPATLAGSPLRSEGVPNGTGFRWFNSDVVLQAGESIAVRLASAPNNSTGVTITLEWEE